MLTTNHDARWADELHPCLYYRRTQARDTKSWYYRLYTLSLACYRTRMPDAGVAAPVRAVDWWQRHDQAMVFVTDRSTTDGRRGTLTPAVVPGSGSLASAGRPAG